MMLKPFRFAFAFICTSILSIAVCVQAQDAMPPVTLHLGDAAPPLASGDFVNGDAVKSFEKGKSYVIDFWASWCGPCRQTIPHLSELQAKYKDIIFIGQDCAERDESAVKPFVKKMGDKMNYRVALDSSAGPDGEMFKTWMLASGHIGLPTVFLIDGEGKIIYIGYPTALDKILESYAAGKYNVKTEIEKASAESKLQEIMQHATESGNADPALSALADFVKHYPDRTKDLNGVKFSLLVLKKDFASANAVAKTLVMDNNDDPQALNFIAFSMVDPDHPYEHADLDLALKAALRANELTKGASNGALDTLAHVYAAKGNKTKAIEAETKAIEQTRDEKSKAELQAFIEKLKASAN